MMDENEQQAFIDRIIREADQECAEYQVAPGAMVEMGPEGKFLTTMYILGAQLEQYFPERKVWKLFALVHLGSGVNWSYPIPAMSEGLMDIRVAMAVGGSRIKRVTYIEGAGTERRVYEVEENHGDTFRMIVTDRGYHDRS